MAFIILVQPLFNVITTPAVRELLWRGLKPAHPYARHYPGYLRKVLIKSYAFCISLVLPVAILIISSGNPLAINLSG